MQRIVFYSWQSDLNGKCNRNLIQDALVRSLKAIKKDETETLEPVLDRDTNGLNGSPSISESIFNKISLSDVFVADVSIINGRSEDKKTPNPNVLIELGYAVSQLGWDRVIMVQNTFYGTPEELPFDLRGRRVIAYTMDPDSDSKPEVRSLLQGRLETALRESLSDSSQGAISSGLNAPIWWGEWYKDNRRSNFGKLFIRETSSNGFLFDLVVMNGSHSGSITGEAVFVARDSAYARIKIPGSNEFGELSFRRSIFDGKRYIRISETVSCQYWRGMGAFFDGEFRCAEDHLFLFGFANEMELQRLYNVMGQYYFELKKVMEQIGEHDNLDTFVAKAYQGGVRGLYTIAEGMVMFGREGEIWAIYLNDGEIRYFTNVHKWKKTIPKTFEQWRERFPEIEINYGSDISTLPTQEDL
ncbi:TIR domain-containing protein [Escherichia coli]|uniref:TIR domain-containing protein n=1 Tax=Escherichia coli TaxID=562 RepID=UPI002010B73C|nr:TIR domain-containing protein [Escherichia coli]